MLFTFQFIRSVLLKIMRTTLKTVKHAVKHEKSAQLSSIYRFVFSAVNLLSEFTERRCRMILSLLFMDRSMSIRFLVCVSGPAIEAPQPDSEEIAADPAGETLLQGVRGQPH